MSAKTLMVNEGLLQEIESRVQTLRELGGVLIQRFADPKFSYAEGTSREAEYEEALLVLREMSGQIFSAGDLVDPEDNELESREEETEDEESEEEGDEEDEDEEDDEGGS